MNKLCYKTVFNRRRNQIMAVAENAASRSSTGVRNRRKKSVDRMAGIGLLSSIVFVAIVAHVPMAQAQVVAYKKGPGNQQATILSGANGTPVVNIQSPNSKGISRNTYSQFDVDEKGVVLNNSRNGAQTAIAGNVSGNPWMAKGTATIILNEVVSSDPSKLNGIVEVAGSRAEVIVANPSGVAVNGGGFINASKVTITAGKPVVQAGAIDGYQVEQGKVKIGEKGLDAGGADYARIIARAVEVNGNIHAKNLAVTTGSNYVSADNKVVNVNEGSGQAPRVALDVSALGGMYAEKITLVGTEKGLGVNNAGVISTEVGGLQLTADGQLVNSGYIISKSKITITKVKKVNNSGTIYSRDDLDMKVPEAIFNSGLLASQGHVVLNAIEVHSTKSSQIIAGLNEDNTIAPDKDVFLDATNFVEANGENIAGGNFIAWALKIDLSNSRTRANRIKLNTTLNRREDEYGVLTTDGAEIVGGWLDIDAGNLENINGKIIQTGEAELTLDLSGKLNNTGGLISSAQGVKIAALGAVNDKGTIYGASDVLVNLKDHLDNGSGQIFGEKTTHVAAGSASNSGLINGSVVVVNKLENKGQISGDATAGDLDNQGIISKTATAQNLLNSYVIGGNAHAQINLTNSGAIGGNASAGATLTNSGQIDGAASGLDIINDGVVIGGASAQNSLINGGSIGGSANAGNSLSNSGLIGGAAGSGGVLSNSGVISGSANAVDIANGGSIGGSASAQHSISNTGSIAGNASAGTALANAGSIGGDASAGGKLANEGWIGGAASAADIENDGGTIIGNADARNNLNNSGEIGGNANAGNKLVNRGMIGGEASALDIDNQDEGIILGNADAEHSLANSGAIIGSASAGSSLSNSGLIAGSASAINVSNAGTVGGSVSARDSIANSGSIGGSASAGISVSNSGSVAGSIAAADVSNGGSVGGDIQARNAISNSGSIGGSASAGVYVNNSGSVAGSVAAADVANGGAVGGNIVAQNNIANSGAVGGSASAGVSVTNSGSVSGSVAAADVTNDNGGSVGGNVLAEKGITNNGVIGGSASAGVSVTNNGLVNGSVAAVDVNNQGGVNGDVWAESGIVNGGTIKGNAGAVSVNNSGAVVGTVVAQDVINDGSLRGNVSAQNGVTNTGVIGGDVSAGTSVKNLGSIDGSVMAGDVSILGGNVGGDVLAKNSLVNGGKISGDALAGTSVVNSGTVVGATYGQEVSNTGSLGSEVFAIDHLKNWGQIGSADGVTVINATVFTNETALHGTAGLRVTATQIINTSAGQLTSDGVTYLNSQEGSLLNQGLIKGKDVIIESAGGLDNQNGTIQGDTFQAKLNGDLNNYKGTIEIAGQTFIRSTGSVLNAEGIFNSGKVALSLVGGVKSSSGEVQASLTATDGDMLILAGQDVTLHDTLFNATGGLKVDTKGTLDMLGIQASAGGNMVLSAAGGVNVSGKSNIQDELSVTSQGKGKKATTETVSDYAEQATTASLNAGGSLVVSSAKDISLNSVTGKGTHLVFDAGGKLEIDGLRDTQQHSVSTLTGNDLQTVKSVLTGEARNKHLGSTFLGDSLQLKAGEDIKVVGSKFAITGSGTLNAGGSIQLDAASETFNAENVTVKDGKTRTSTSSSVSYVGSAIDVGGSLQATAGKSLSVTGSSLSSGGTMLVKAGEDISLSSQLGSSITQEGKNTETSTTRVQALLDSAGGLTLEGGGNVTLMGAELQAEETLRLTVGQDLTTVGSTFEAKNVHLAVGNNLFDINGKVAASEDILVVAEHNLALHQDGQDTQLNYSAGQDLKLYSKQDMSLYNVDLSAGRDLVADAAGKLDITARSDSTSTKTGKWGRISDTHWSVSELQAGRDLSLKSGSDLQLQGAKLQAQGDITVAAEGKMEWLAVADRHGQDDLARAPSVGNLFGKAGASNQGSLNWQDVSLDAGGKVEVSAGGDFTAEGGRVRAGSDLQIVMGGQGHFKSLVSGEQSHLAGGTAYFSNRELSEDQASFASQAKGFMGEAGGNLTIVSQDSMDMEAVSLKAGQDLALGAMKNLTLSAAFEESEQETEESLKSWSRSDELFPWGAEDEEKRAGNSSYEKRVVGNQLQAGGNLILAAGEALALVATDGKGKDITLYGGTNLAVSGAYGEIGAETRENNFFYGFGENEARDPRYLVEQSGSTNFIGSQLTGENLNVYSGGDAKLMGSRFELSGNAKIVAEKTLELGAAQENSAENRNGTPFLYSFKGNVAGSQSLNWSGTQLHARGTVDLESGGDLSVLGSQVSAGGSLTAKSKGSLKVGSLLNVEQDSQFWGRQDYRSELAAAGLTSGGTLRLSAEGDIGLNGVRVASGAELLAHAGKDLYLGNLRTDNQDWWRNNDEKYEVSKLTAVGNVELEAEHDLLASGGSIRSGEGNVLLDGAHKIELASVTDQKVRINSKSSGSFFTKDTTTTKVTGTVHGVEIETGGAGKLTFRSEGDVRLESTDLDVGRGGVEVDIGGKLTLAMASDSYQKVTQKSSEWVVWQKQSVDGKREVTGVENQLTTTGPIVIKAAGGMDIEYAQRRGESAEDALARAQGSSWAKGITPDLEVSWKASPDKKKTWHSSQQGLTQVGASIVAVFAGVYGFQFYSQAVGYTSTVTTAAGTTVTTVTGTTFQGATAAAATAMTTDALVQLGTTGKIDGDNVLRAGAMGFATFGVTNAKLWGADGSQSLNDLAGLKSNAGTLDIAKGGFLENLSGEQLLALGGRSLVKAGLEHAIYGTDLGDSFKGGLASDLGALLAKDIGDKWGNGKNFGMQTLAHMGLAATMAELAGRDPAAAALGVVMENVLDNATNSAGLKIDPDNPGDRSLYTATSIFGAGLAADLLGMDTNAATIAAQNAAENNRLLSSLEVQRIKKLADGDPIKEARLTAAACALTRCYAEYPEGSEAYNSFKLIAERGQSSDYYAERSILQSQKGLFTYTTSGFLNDQWVDSVKQADNTYQIGNRSLGAFNAVMGGLGLTAAVTSAPLSCATGIGCIANGVAVGLTLDSIYAGTRQLVSGSSELTTTNIALQSMGLSPDAASYVEFVLGVSAAAKAGAVINNSININSAANSWAKGTYNGSSAIEYEGRVYRFSDPKYADTVWDIHDGNIAANHRYSGENVGAVYSGTSIETAAAEVGSYRNGSGPLSPKVLVAGDVYVSKVLDLTDSGALKALGVTRQEIVQSSHGANGSYIQTQRIAEWARAEGYNAILAPSAQNKSGTNLITFDSTKVVNVRISIPY